MSSFTNPFLVQSRQECNGSKRGFISYCHEVLEGIKLCRAHCTTYNLKISFEFTATYIDDEAVPVLVKLCGVLPIYVSDILNFIQKVELELEFDDRSNIRQDLDELDLDALKSEMIWKMKEEPVPQSRKFDLMSLSNCNNLEDE